MLPHHSAALLPFVGDVPVAGAIEEQILVFFGQIAPRFFQIDAQRIGHTRVNMTAPTPHAAQGSDYRNGSVVKAERSNYETP